MEEGRKEGRKEGRETYVFHVRRSQPHANYLFDDRRKEG
jgi:hypothetical protein